jgi:hypothetical protein
VPEGALGTGYGPGVLGVMTVLAAAAVAMIVAAVRAAMLVSRRAP